MNVGDGLLQHQQQQEVEDEAALLAELEDALLREAVLLQHLQQQQQGQQQDQMDMSFQEQQQQQLRRQQQPHPMEQMSDVERDYALRLKAKVDEKEANDCDDDDCRRQMMRRRPLNDFQYAHHAIVEFEGDDIISESSIERTASKIIGLQEFRATYGITDTVEQGMEMLEAFMTQQSGFVLHLDLCDESHESIQVLDVATLNPQAAMSFPDNLHWKQFVCGLYYMHTACSPTLASIRQGIFEIADLDSFGSHNFNMEFEYRRHGELLTNYPLKFKTIMAYNTGYWANLSWNLMKPLINANVRDSIQLGCQVVESDGSSSNRRLSEFYLQPSLPIAQQSVLARARTMLQIRYQNEKQFTLL